MNNSNLSIKKEIVNSKEEESKEISFPINSQAIQLLEPEFSETGLFLYLVSKMTLNNAIVGVFHNVTIYSIATHFSVDRIQVKRTLAKLERKKLIKILHNSPLIIQILEVYRTCTIETFKDCLLYVKQHEEQFNFHDYKYKFAKDRFYSDFKQAYILLNEEIKQKEFIDIYESKKEQAAKNYPLKLILCDEPDDDNPFADTEPNS